MRLVRHSLPLINSWWLMMALTMMFLSFICLEMASRIICSLTASGTEVRLTSLSYLDGPSCPSWGWVQCLLFVVIRSLLALNLLWPFKSISSIPVTGASSSSTLRCMPFGPIWMSKWVKWSPFYLLLLWVQLHTYRLLWGSETWEGRGQTLPRKTEVKNPYGIPEPFPRPLSQRSLPHWAISPRSHWSSFRYWCTYRELSCFPLPPLLVSARFAP